MLEFPLLCRLCGLKTENGLYIYCDEGKRRQVETKIRLYLHFQVLPSDSLPKKICASCFDELEGMHRFAINALKVQDHLSRVSKELPITAIDVCKTFMTSYVHDAVLVNDAVVSLKTQEVTEMEVQVDPMVFLEDDQMDESMQDGNHQVEKDATAILDGNQENCPQGTEDFEKRRNDESTALDLEEPSKQLPCDSKTGMNFVANMTIQNLVLHTPSAMKNQTYPLKLVVRVDERPNDNQLKESESTQELHEVLQQGAQGKQHSLDTQPLDEQKSDLKTSGQNGNLLESPKKLDVLPQKPSTPVLESGGLSKAKKATSKGSKKVETKLSTSDSSKCATFTCPICKKIFTRKGLFRTHLDIHKTDDKFACEICMRVFKKETNLIRHKTSHTELTTYPCAYCNRVYPTKSTLRSHLVSHSDERPHVCSICSKSFKRNQDLKFHLNQHNGLRPYRCPYCTKAFASSGNCFSHRRRAHMQEIERDRALKKSDTPAV